jgi:hypothetical protein
MKPLLSSSDGPAVRQLGEIAGLTELDGEEGVSSPSGKE